MALQLAGTRPRPGTPRKSDRKATDTLGVLPELEIKSLPMASLSLRNRFCAAAGNLDELLLIAEDGVIDDTERTKFDSIVEEMRDLMA